MLPADEQQLRQMLDLNVLPPELVQEYTKRRALRSRASGGGGGFSPDGLVDLVRACGLEAKETLPAAKDDIRWEHLAPGTVISVKWNNETKKARFHKFQQGGVVLFFLEGDNAVRTAPRVHCDLWREPEPASDQRTVSVFHQGHWVEGAVKRVRSNGDYEVSLPGDEKVFRVFTAEHVKELELVA